jgi:hypothetical protein
MKEKKRILFSLIVFVIVLLSFETEIFSNLIGVITARGYVIPTESSLAGFKVTRMNEGSGEWRR